MTEPMNASHQLHALRWLVVPTDLSELKMKQSVGKGRLWNSESQVRVRRTVISRHQVPTCENP